MIFFLCFSLFFFCQVQTQSRPQAIFTSFKLEKNGKASSPLPSESSFQLKTPINQTPENHTDESGSKESPTNFSVQRLNDSTGSGSNDRKRRLSFSSSPSNDTEKVSIVRAAGTFFPQNCDNDAESSPPSSLRRKSKDSVDYPKKCSVSNCSQSNDAHIHCDDCSEVCFQFFFSITISTRFKLIKNYLIFQISIGF